MQGLLVRRSQSAATEASCYGICGGLVRKDQPFARCCAGRTTAREATRLLGMRSARASMVTAIDAGMPIAAAMERSKAGDTKRRKD